MVSGQYSVTFLDGRVGSISDKMSPILDGVAWCPLFTVLFSLPISALRCMSHLTLSTKLILRWAITISMVLKLCWQEKHLAWLDEIWMEVSKHWHKGQAKRNLPPSWRQCSDKKLTMTRSMGMLLRSTDSWRGEKQRFMIFRLVMSGSNDWIHAFGSSVHRCWWLRRDEPYDPPWRPLPPDRRDILQAL